MIERKILLHPDSDQFAVHLKFDTDDEMTCSTCEVGLERLSAVETRAINRSSKNFTAEAIIKCDTVKRRLGECGIGQAKFLSIARDYTDKDEETLDAFVKSRLGQQATARYLGVRAKGVKGDEAVYCHAVVLSDPTLVNHESRKLDYDRLADISTAITNTIEIAGNVTLDLSSLYRPPADQ